MTRDPNDPMIEVDLFITDDDESDVHEYCERQELTERWLTRKDAILWEPVTVGKA